MNDDHEPAEGDKVVWDDDIARVQGLASVEPDADEVFVLDGRKLRAVVAPPTVKSDCDLCALRMDLDRCLQIRCEGDLRGDGNYVIMKDADE